MTTTIRRIAKSLLPKRVIEMLFSIENTFFDESYALKSYSQEGEDMILRRIFERQESGFYIDVGACHPKRFSNTYFFYQKGWRGINIDAMPGSMEPFKKKRPRDINIEAAISDNKEVLKYYAFNDPASNSFLKELSQERDGYGHNYIKFTIDIQTSTLEEILDKYLPITCKKIDFLSIDVEGLDFQVLKSNNFEKYKPTVILIEMLGSNLFDIQNDQITKYLVGLGYSFIAKTINTSIFINTEYQ